MIRVLSFLSLLAAPTAAQPRQPERYVIPVAEARCLVRNADKYVAAKDELLVIYVSLCPKVNPTARELAQAAANSVRVNPGSTNIVIERARLRCLINAISAQLRKAGRSPTIAVDASRC
jgi:hypothetical protein